MASDSTLAVVNIVASFTALYMCMSPAPTILRIYKLKCTGHMPLLPIVAQWAYNHIWMLYGFLTNAYFPLFATYAVGSFLSIAFLAIFFYSTDRAHKGRVAQLIGVALLFNIGTSCYAFFGPRVQQFHHVVQIIGFLAIACGLALYASPFATIRIVITSKNAISIPIGMVLVGTISNATWIVYGALMDDFFIVGPTIVNTCLCVAQLVLYVVYRPGRRRKRIVRAQHESESLSDSTSPESFSPNHSEQELSFVMAETPKSSGSSGVYRTHDVAERA